MKMDKFDIWAIGMYRYNNPKDYLTHGQSEYVEPDATGICRCLRKRYLEINYEDGVLTADGTPWEQKLEEIKNLNLCAREHMEELHKFKRGWDVHESKWFNEGYWQWKVPGKLWKKICDRYNDIMEFIHNKPCTLDEKELSKLSIIEFESLYLDCHTHHYEIYSPYLNMKEDEWNQNVYTPFYMVLDYSNNKLTLNGIDWKKMFAAIKAMPPELASKELKHFIAGWFFRCNRCTVPDLRSRANSYWQYHLPIELVAKVLDAYDEVKYHVDEMLWATGADKKSPQPQEVKESAEEIIAKYTEIISKLQYKENLDFRDENGTLTIYGYSVRDIKKAIFFNMHMFTAPGRTIPAGTCCRWIRDIDVQVNLFNETHKENVIDLLDVNSYKLCLENVWEAEKIRNDPKYADKQKLFGDALRKNIIACHLVP